MISWGECPGSFDRGRILAVTCLYIRIATRIQAAGGRQSRSYIFVAKNKSIYIYVYMCLYIYMHTGEVSTDGVDGARNTSNVWLLLLLMMR